MEKTTAAGKIKGIARNISMPQRLCLAYVKIHIMYLTKSLDGFSEIHPDICMHFGTCYMAEISRQTHTCLLKHNFMNSPQTCHTFLKVRGKLRHYNQFSHPSWTTVSFAFTLFYKLLYIKSHFLFHSQNP